ncbi:uncharacterized protein LOC115212787 [Octopus sinensis]|uniref:Uncharacterized protein LOC115212787 n=1 Tax=Octopus sinensis TaxID=2607531 RepID=A0A7E6EWP9_9MOLL|nr:uncharacterized protein LOC115212787 [Octopus sinensis]
MIRLFPICLLFLIKVTVSKEADGNDCKGCFFEDKCRKYEEEWLEKLEIMCATRTCHRMSDVEWKVYAKSVFCLTGDGECVENGTTWAAPEDDECWTHTCKILGTRNIRIESTSGGDCADATTNSPNERRNRRETSLRKTKRGPNGPTEPTFYSR